MGRKLTRKKLREVQWKVDLFNTYTFSHMMSLSTARYFFTRGEIQLSLRSKMLLFLTICEIRAWNDYL